MLGTKGLQMYEFKAHIDFALDFLRVKMNF